MVEVHYTPNGSVYITIAERGIFNAKIPKKYIEGNKVNLPLFLQEVYGINPEKITEN